MRRTVRVLMLLATLGGPLAARAGAGEYMKNVWTPPPDGASTGARYPRTVPDFVGPYGLPVEARAPAQLREPTGEDYARSMLSQQFPPDVLRQAGFTPTPGSGIRPVQGCGPGGCPPPGMGPGGMPGMGMGPAVGPGGLGGGAFGPPGAVAAVGVTPGPPFGSFRTEVRFVGPAGMRISWYAPRADGRPGFSAQYLEAPARYNFLQASIYRLKLSDIPNRPGVELYPTLEVVPANARTATFLAHSAVPIAFTEDDFEQVAAGNFVVKVVYLPDPRFQDLTLIGPGGFVAGEVVSSQLEPGVDPIAEAQRRGSILLIIRLGNIDLEAPNTPAMDAPGPHGPANIPGMIGPKLPLPPGAMGPPMLPPGMLPGLTGPAGPGAPSIPGAPARPVLPATPGAPPAASKPLQGPPLPTPATPVGAAPSSSGAQPVNYIPGGYTTGGYPGNPR